MIFYFCPDCKQQVSEDEVTISHHCAKCNCDIIETKSPANLCEIDNLYNSKDHIKLPFTEKLVTGDQITIFENPGRPVVFVGYQLDSILVTNDFGRTLVPLKYKDYKKTWEVTK